MSVLNVFLIGTGHTQDEEFNLLVVLHNLVLAEEIKTREDFEMVGDSFTSSDLTGDVKILFDGPGLTDLAPAAGAKMTTVRDEVRRLAEAMKKKQGSPVSTVNLIGHSRGAITAVYAANKLADEGLVTACNLVLVDPVKRASIPDDEANILPGRTNDCIVIAMEDEAFFGSVKPPGMTGNIFKLEKITRADNSANTYIRLPGTHGTATQCNPITSEKQVIKEVGTAADSATAKALKLIKKPLWPIGGVVLRRCLLQLSLWGTSLHVGTGLTPAALQQRLQEEILEDYFSILLKNPFNAGKKSNTGAKFKRLVNDTKKSKSGEIQKYEEKHGYRTDAFLTGEVGIPHNPWRYTPLFINQDHATLFTQQFSNAFPELVAHLTNFLHAPEGKKVLDIAKDAEAPLRQTLINQVGTLTQQHRVYEVFLRGVDLRIAGFPHFI